MPLLISDTSTLIHLAAIGKLALLRDLYQKITVPSAVWKEVVEGGKGRIGTVEIEAARQTGWIAIMPPTNELLIRLLKRDLDEGESEVIALAIERQANLIPLDETDARQVAERYSLPKTGVKCTARPSPQDDGLLWPRTSSAREDIPAPGFRPIRGWNDRRVALLTSGLVGATPITQSSKANLAVLRPCVIDFFFSMFSGFM